MEDLIKYRYNVMNINSIDAFLSVRGGYNNNLRDVYFVRALGESKNYAKSIYEAEDRIEKDRKKSGVKYLRIDQLPGLKNPEDITYYTTIYDNWKKEGKLSFQNRKVREEILEIISKAIQRISELYKEEKHASESMIRNFISKVLFWFDQIINECLENWSEKSIIKIIAENVGKEQEYLFYFFLTNIGCDVMLLENRADIAISERLKKLSTTIQLGEYGTSILEKYKRNMVLSSNDRIVRCSSEENKETDRKESKIKITIPEHRRKKSQEKTFEELAQLSSSIVMIAIHDRNGEVYGTGSGIMIGVKGYILTNYHVIAGGCFFSICIEGEKETYRTDEVIKYNPNLDLAVIRIQRKLNPLMIYSGSKKLVRGQKVVAIGSPLGLFNSVSDGIISGFRTIRDMDMIQFTAPISPGSSGGAVLNMFGELIGISTAEMDHGQNINLAVSYEHILSLVRGLMS